MDVNIREAYNKILRARREFDNLRARVESGDVVLRSELEKFVFLNFGSHINIIEGYEERLKIFEELDEKLRASRGKRLVLKLTSAREDMEPEHGCFGGTPGYYSFEEMVYSGLLSGEGISFGKLERRYGLPGSSVIFPTKDSHETLSYCGASFHPGKAEITSDVLKGLVRKSYDEKPKVLLEHLPHLTGIKNPISSLMNPYSSEVLLGREAEDFLKTLEIEKH